MISDSLNFRQLARESLARAKVELSSENLDRVRYAALNLRDALEALTYDRARAYESEIPPDKFKNIWQPQKLMAVLVDIDPSIGRTSTFAFARQDGPGKPARREEMKVLGTDHVLSLKDLKDHYNALGSFLHMPSLDQMASGKGFDPGKMRVKCVAIIEIIEKVLSSRTWNSKFGMISTLEQCMNEECKKPIARRVPAGRDAFDAECFECGSEYELSREPGDEILWTPKVVDVSCETEGCQGKAVLWKHQIRFGHRWKCRACGVDHELVLIVAKAESEK